MRLLAIVGLLLAAVAPTAAGQLLDQPEMERLDYRPAFLFNQHLYRGTMSRPRALAYDRERRELWVAETDGGVVGVFNSKGVELFSFTSKTFLRDPARIAVTPDGSLAVIEGQRRELQLFSYRGEHLGTVPLEKIGEKPSLGAVAYDRTGNLFVGDNASSQIFVYAPSGTLKFQFGSFGSDEGQFTAISGIVVGEDGRIYVSDQRAIAVQVFDNQGNFQRGWGKHEMGADNFSLPSGIALDSKERVIVTDELRHTVKLFSNDGKLLLNFGGLGSGLGQLSFPTDVVVDERDRIFVSERTTSRVQVFEPTNESR